MEITIRFRIPVKKEIFSKGIEIKVARKKERWVKSHLGDYAIKRGLYVHYCNNEILYVGITIKKIGKWGNFAERLRREFQYSSSQNSSLHKLLCEQKKPTKVSFYDLDEIDELFRCSTPLTPEKKVLIAEQILIEIYDPPGNKKDKTKREAANKIILDL